MGRRKKRKPAPAKPLPEGVTLDGFTNSISGLGTSRDKREYAAVSPPRVISAKTASDMYHGNDVAHRICRLPAEEMMREGFRFWQGEEEGDEALGKSIHQFFDDNHLPGMLTDALTYARVHGTSFIFVGADDGRSPATPLRYDKIKSIKFFNIIEMEKLSVNTWYENPYEPEYGKPETYSAQRLNHSGASTGAPQIIIHESRLLRFEGTKTTPERMRRNNRGFSDSIFVRMYEMLRGYHGTWGSVEMLMQELSVGILKIQGLHRLMKAGEGSKVLKRLNHTNLTKSTNNSITIDAEKEDFYRVQTPLGGVPEVLAMQMSRVAAGAGIPVTLLFGESPGGLNSTGESDERNWVNTIAGYQEDILRAQLERLLKMILSANDGPAAGTEPEEWSFEFNPLRRPNLKEQAEIRKTMAETDAAYHAIGALTAHEIALSRFGGDEWAMETKIDVDTRRSIMDTEEDLEDAKPNNEPGAANPNTQPGGSETGEQPVPSS